MTCVVGKPMTTLLDRHLKVPKYLQLAETLRAQLDSGELSPGDRLPSFTQLRRQHAATQSTIEKALELLERDGLITRSQYRGTFVAPRSDPESSAIPSRGNEGSALPRIPKGILGISGVGFSFDSYSAYWTAVLRGMRKAAASAGVQILLLDHDSSSGWEKADGVVVCDWAALDVLRQRAPGQPVVSLFDEIEGIASVVADERDGARQATRHLLDLGHRRIGYMHGGSQVIVRRLAGYRETLAEAGITPDGRWTRLLINEYWRAEDFTARACQTMQQWLRDDWESLGCTALLVQNDAAALGVIRALTQSGIRVPEEVSVIGYDGAEQARAAEISITTVQVPLEEIGATAISLLLSQIQLEQETGLCQMLPVTLLEQSSTATAKPTDLVTSGAAAIGRALEEV